MRHFLLGFGLSLFLTQAVAQKQLPFPQTLKKELCLQVQDACRHAWKGYMDYAAGYDELRPLTKNGKNWYSRSLLMTPVDAFDTFILLGLKKEAAEARQMILSQLRFDLPEKVQVFEITIRLLAGLETAYELDGDKRFLDLATDLADRMLPAFGSATGMPYRYVDLVTGQTADSINNPAEIGTLMLEFGKLSRLTGKQKYYNAAKKAIMAVYARRSPLDLVGTQIHVETGTWTDSESHIGGMIDSYYEYLYKAWVLFGDPDFKKAWDKHQAAIKKHLVVRQENGWFTKHVDMNTGAEKTPAYGALDAFYAGLCAYAGDLPLARGLQKANYWMWTHFNLEPESFNFKTNELQSSYYILRPENLESCFYLYRKTREPAYLWMGKRMVDDIIRYCKNEPGFASLKNVTNFEKTNSMQSFFFAETLKYAYLLFAPDAAADLKKIVFNTEAHPFIITQRLPRTNTSSPNKRP